MYVSARDYRWTSTLHVFISCRDLCSPTNPSASSHKVPGATSRSSVVALIDVVLDAPLEVAVVVSLDEGLDVDGTSVFVSLVLVRLGLVRLGLVRLGLVRVGLVGRRAVAIVTVLDGCSLTPYPGDVRNCGQTNTTQRSAQVRSARDGGSARDGTEVGMGRSDG